MRISDIVEELAGLEVNPLEGDRYAACMETYEASSNQRQRIIDWIKGEVIPGLSTAGADVLSIGCGAGDLDREILAAGVDHSAEISYVGLEPDPRQCERFISRMGFAADPTVQVEARNVPFEGFGERRRFDLVLMIHSLYYMKDPQHAVEKARELVNEDGRLAVFIAANDTLNELPAAFWDLESDRPTWFSEDLKRYLESNGIPFEHQRIEAVLDATPCCDPDSERGVRIADFLAQVPTAELSERLRGMIFDYLEATSRRDGDRRWLPHNVDAFVIEAA